MWDICLFIVAGLIATSLFLAFLMMLFRNKAPEIFDSAKILVVGVVSSAVTLFIPIYHNIFVAEKLSEPVKAIMTALVSLHNTIRLFVVDGDFDFITENLKRNEVEGITYTAYCVLFSILFVVAPALTFSFVLSFFKNVSAYAKYYLSLKSGVYIFSELNENSLALARDIRKNHKRNSLLVFTDVFDNDDEKSYELIHHAKVLGAVCFKKDITTIKFGKLNPLVKFNFFIIGEDYNENIGQALKLGEKYKYKKNTNMYVCSTKVESEALLSNVLVSKENEKRRIHMKIRRVNDVYSLIMRTLYETGYEKVFSTAVEDENGIKWINALVVGMGQHGTEMTKSLAWFCQMDGYRLRVNAMDIDKKAESKFKSLCPELMDDDYNDHFDVDGEAGYSIKVHSEVDVDTEEFDKFVCGLPQITYVFVALGDDEKNVATAIKLRSLFLRKGYKPAIQTIVYNTEKKNSLIGIKNYGKQEYEIDFIGDIKSSYSEKVIMNSDIENKALARHLNWGDEASFWQYDYNRKSSMASAVHREMKIKCKIPGIEKEPKEREEAELWNIRKLEHNRWNAYMRSEGYVHGKERNDLAKVHHLLVPFVELPLKEQVKDDD